MTGSFDYEPGTVTANAVMTGTPSGSDTTTGSTEADLAVAVADSADPVALGDTVTYTATVANGCCPALILQTKPSPRMPIWDPGLVGTVTWLSAW